MQAIHPAAQGSHSPLSTATSPATPQHAALRYLTNEEAAALLRLSPRTLEKQRVQGGGPRFRKFGRRVMYAMTDLEAWADAQVYDMTSDPEYLARHAGR
ncbi:helix-turn-helix domain-containing protein [Alcaligenes sp. NLF5-7]|uniref:helix-turn-helix domain-containing protein n=1 Tax=Alcaligenes sp. NLF5-7 TaxID=2918755 RepID=UPI0020C464B5|nr:helix-turn-helix domain-containing protein [Alcaligenes sp. NLF5-7]UTM01063.1 helix-turn-helix domain-containing protein [Alcaligenes sp. NLF5-7]